MCISSVQLLSRVQLFATPWIAARQASLSITNSWSSLKLMCIESVMPSSHLILCHPLLLLPPIPLSIRVFSNESTLRMRWPKYWSFSLSISPSNIYIYFSYNFLSIYNYFKTKNLKQADRQNPKRLDTGFQQCFSFTQKRTTLLHRKGRLRHSEDSFSVENPFNPLFSCAARLEMLDMPIRVVPYLDWARNCQGQPKAK